MAKKTDSIPQGLRFDVFRRDSFTCRYCGRSSPNVILHCDHIKARSKGGETTLDNLITACSDCNFGKRAKDVDIEQPTSSPGLVGCYGHEYEDGKINLQFKIVRKVNENLYMIQFYSFWFGEPTNIEARTLEFLIGPNCKLYANYNTWREVCDLQIQLDSEDFRGRRDAVN